MQENIWGSDCFYITECINFSPSNHDKKRILENYGVLLAHCPLAFLSVPYFCVSSELILLIGSLGVKKMVGFKVLF